MAKKEIENQGSAAAAGKSGKMSTRDYIYAGAFGAVYLVLMLIIVMGSGVIPVLYLMSPLTVGIVCGTVYELCVLKVRKFGAALILGVLFALIACLNAWPGFALAVCAALAAELVIKLGGYRSRRMYLASFAVFNINMCGPFLMLLYARDQFIALVTGYRGPEMAATMSALTPSWLWFAQLALALVGGTIGALIASRLIDKHFKAAGIV